MGVQQNSLCADIRVDVCNVTYRKENPVKVRNGGERVEKQQQRIDENRPTRQSIGVPISVFVYVRVQRIASYE